MARESTKRACDEQSRLTAPRRADPPGPPAVTNAPILIRMPGGGFSVDARVAPFTTSSGAENRPGFRSVAHVRRAKPRALAVSARSRHAHPPGLESKRPRRSPVVAATEAMSMSTALARLAFGARASTSTSALSSLVRHFGASRGFHGASGSLAAAKKGATAASEEEAHTHSATVATDQHQKGGAIPSSSARLAASGLAVGLDRAEEDSIRAGKGGGCCEALGEIRRDGHRRHQAAGQAARACQDQGEQRRSSWQTETTSVYFLMNNRPRLLAALLTTRYATDGGLEARREPPSLARVLSRETRKPGSLRSSRVPFDANG